METRGNALLFVPGSSAELSVLLGRLAREPELPQVTVPLIIGGTQAVATRSSRPEE